MLDEHDHFTVFTEWGSRKFFDVLGRAWAFTGSLTVPSRKTSDCDLLQMTRDAFGAVAERASSGQAKNERPSKKYSIAEDTVRWQVLLLHRI